MKMRLSITKPAAFSRLELLVVISIVVVLIGLLLPVLAKAKSKTSKIKCSSSLKQVVLSAKMFAGDNDGHYPFGATNSLAYQDTNAVWRHFMAMSNELGSTKILICGYDQERATNTVAVFGDYRNPDLPSLEERKNSAVSYFIALRSKQSETNAQGIFFGDRNVLIPGKAPKDLRLSLTKGDRVQWDSRIHNKRGNIAFEDGSVSSFGSSAINEEPQPVDLLLPLFP